MKGCSTARGSICHQGKYLLQTTIRQSKVDIRDEWECLAPFGDFHHEARYQRLQVSLKLETTQLATLPIAEGWMIGIPEGHTALHHRGLQRRSSAHLLFRRVSCCRVACSRSDRRPLGATRLVAVRCCSPRKLAKMFLAWRKRPLKRKSRFNSVAEGKHG